MTWYWPLRQVVAARLAVADRRAGEALELDRHVLQHVAEPGPLVLRHAAHEAAGLAVGAGVLAQRGDRRQQPVDEAGELAGRDSPPARRGRRAGGSPCAGRRGWGRGRRACRGSSSVERSRSGRSRSTAAAASAARLRRAAEPSGASAARRCDIVAAAGGEEVHLEPQHGDRLAAVDGVAVREAQAGGVDHRHARPSRARSARRRASIIAAVSSSTPTPSGSGL